MIYPRIPNVPIALTILVLLSAKASAGDEAPIKDNSFLIEEAYNQDPGVIQHIVTAQHAGDPRHFWGLAFTHEMPLRGMKHQIGWTLPFLSLDTRDNLGVGDVSIHYRYQAVDGNEGLALSPRLSIFLPTGAEGHRGSGAVAWQANVPVSIELSTAFMLHLNAGATLTPDQEIDSRVWGYPVADDLWGYHFGGSVVWLTLPTVNFLCEALYVASEDFGEGGRVSTNDELIVNPGARFAVNTSFGQFVPGFSVPLSRENGVTVASIFTYLSFEHSL